jgi:murein DD-endopeptidase MepM/ murein hydrolase activator NlpD
MTENRGYIAIRHSTAAVIAAVLVLAAAFSGAPAPASAPMSAPASASGAAGFAGSASAPASASAPVSASASGSADSPGLPGPGSGPGSGFAPSPGPGPGPSDLFVYADEKSDLEGKIKRAKRDVTSAKSDYRDKKNEEAGIGEKIEKLTASIRKTEKELKAVEKDIKDNDAKITVIEGDIERLDAEVGTQNSELMGRLRAMYSAGDISILEVLLDSENIIDFLSNLDMIQWIHAYDVGVLSELNGKLDLVESKKAELVRVKATLDEQRRVEKEKKAGLAGDKKELVAAQAKARAEAEEALDDLEELEAASKSLEAELKELKSRTSYGGGRMGWPVSGAVSSGFGSRIHPISGSRRMHTGIDIAASTGTPVRAASDGIVVKSSVGWNGGYGNIVIIDHGSGITTLYGHNSSLAAAVGGGVKRGDVIAYVGSTGNSTGPHCHFEVRVNGMPQNPMGWL